MELYENTLAALSNMLKSRQVSSQELTQSVFENIHRQEPEIQAYITLCEEQAMEQAKEADRLLAQGQGSALTGIPLGLKDNLCTDGVLTTCASKMLYNFRPPYSATVVDKLKAQGAVFTGKLNMDEFAMGSSCETSYFKKTRNPRDLTRVPGGSSGGSAAAVAANECVAALGSDTGGSIRQPSAYCGITGLKPTYGSVSRFGLVAFASSLDQIGPMAKTAEDAALLYAAICGHDSKDATSADRSYPSAQEMLTGSLKGKTVGIPKEYYGKGVEPQVADKVLAACKVMEQQGAALKEISLPSTDYALSAYYIISSAEASSNLARYDGVKYGFRAQGYENLLDLYEKTRSEGFGDEVKRRIMLGTFVLSSGYYDAYYKRAKLLQQQIMAEFASAFEHCDLLVTPTTPGAAFRFGENDGDPLKMYACDICTVTVNIAGVPALSMPCGSESNGLPVGMQLIGDRFGDSTLLSAAHELQRCGVGR